MHNIIVNMEQYHCIKLWRENKRRLHSFRQQMGGRGWYLMPCSAPEFWTAAFEGPGICAFKPWDRKQIKRVTVDRVLAYSSAMLGSP